MRKIIFICLSVLFASCLNKGVRNETEMLNQRITFLEQKIDSVISDMNTNSTALNNRNGDSSLFYGTVTQMNRCQALTKKGIQCKRKAKNSGYCWQHEG
jgi:hypothetical protein